MSASRELSPDTSASALHGAITEAAHTPGPWSVCGDERGGCKCNTIMSENHPIATFERGEWGNEWPSLRVVGGSLDRTAEPYMEFDAMGEIPDAEALANARLIAAAPDLLAALRDALRKVKQYAPNGFERSAPFERAHAAISKALGAPTASPATGSVQATDEPK